MEIANICDRKKINHRKVKEKKNSSNKSTWKYSKSKKVLRNKPSKKETKRELIVREDKQENSKVWRVDTFNICWTHKHKLRSI